MFVTRLRHKPSVADQAASKVAMMVKQENAPQMPNVEYSPIPDPSMSQLTVDAFYALLEDVDLDEVFEEFIVPAKPHG